MDDKELCNGINSGNLPGVLPGAVPDGCGTHPKLRDQFMDQCCWKFIAGGNINIPALNKIPGNLQHSFTKQS